MNCLGLDIGGANLKAADGHGFAISRYFPLWQRPNELGHALAEVLADSPPAGLLAVTMTGELADCFATKADGVRTILDHVSSVAGGRDVIVYRTNGTFARSAEEAKAKPHLVAAANWHALASLACWYVRHGPALLIDIGSTTTDIVPLRWGQPAPQGASDTERLQSGELLYTGVQRSPLCAVVAEVPFRGRPCPVAHEVFATTWDVYLTLGDLREDPRAIHTADGRPATRQAARDRLARSICADRESYGDDDAAITAQTVAAAQYRQILDAVQSLVRRWSEPPRSIIVSGVGEFLAVRVAQGLGERGHVISLCTELGENVSRAAAAHAVAVLAGDSPRG